MKKRILILAGGVASRMKKAASLLSTVDSKLIEQADTLTKGMIGVGNSGKSLIDYQVHNAYLAGFEEILLLLHPEDTVTQAHYENRMAQEQTWGIRLFFARQRIAPERVKPAGTADAVWQALQQQPAWQKGRFIVCNSDNLYSVNALQLLWDSPHANALISYDRNTLEFPTERIKSFALIKTDSEGFLKAITEKPSDEEVAEVLRQQGRIGVSMNCFVFDASLFLPYLEKTPFHPVRNEREITTTVAMFVEDHPKGFFTIPLAENVPDLTSKNDIGVVQEYLAKNYQHF